jgi:hypothetical protein
MPQPFLDRERISLWNAAKLKLNTVSLEYAGDFSRFIEAPDRSLALMRHR